MLHKISPVFFKIHVMWDPIPFYAMWYRIFLFRPNNFACRTIFIFMPIIFMPFSYLVSKLICHLNDIDSDFVEMQVWTKKCRSNSVAAFNIDLSTTGVMDITHRFPLTFICIMNQILAGQLDFTTRSTKNAPFLRFQNKLFVCRKRARIPMSDLVSCIRTTCSGIAEVERF